MEISPLFSHKNSGKLLKKNCFSSRRPQQKTQQFSKSKADSNSPDAVLLARKEKVNIVEKADLYTRFFARSTLLMAYTPVEKIYYIDRFTKHK